MKGLEQLRPVDAGKTSPLPADAKFRPEPSGANTLPLKPRPRAVPLDQQAVVEVPRPVPRAEFHRPALKSSPSTQSPAPSALPSTGIHLLQYTL